MAVDFVDSNPAYIGTGTTSLPTAYPITIFAVARPDTFTNSSSQSIYAWSDFSAFGTANMLGFAGYGGSPAGLYPRWWPRASGEPTGGKCESSTDYSAYKQLFLVGKSSGATDHELWVNGTLDTSSSTSVTFPANLDVSTIGILGRSSAYSTDPAQGVIECVAIWDADLSDQEVKQLTTAYTKDLPLSIQKSNLRGYWVLDDVAHGVSGDTVTFKDYSGTGNNGTGTANGGTLTGEASTLTYTGGIIYTEISSGTNVTVNVNAQSLAGSMLYASAGLPLYFYNRFKKNLFSGLIDFGGSGSHTVNIALLDNTYTFDADHNIWSQISSAEIAGTGYSAGGKALTGLSISTDTTNDFALFDADNVTWTSSTFTARYAVLYDATLINNDLIGIVDFGSNVSVTVGTFTLNWANLGIIAVV